MTDQAKIADLEKYDALLEEIDELYDLVFSPKGTIADLEKLQKLEDEVDELHAELFLTRNPQTYQANVR